MKKYEKQFRKEKPETIGETDQHFDLDNYKDWLESKLDEAYKLLNELEREGYDFSNWQKL